MPKSACWNRANTVNKEYLTTTTVQNTFNKQYIEAILCQKHVRNEEVQLYISFHCTLLWHCGTTVVPSKALQDKSAAAELNSFMKLYIAYDCDLFIRVHDFERHTSVTQTK